MLTRARFQPPITGHEPTDALGRAIAAYFLALEKKGALQIDSAYGLDNTPIGANSPSTGKFASPLVVNAASGQASIQVQQAGTTNGTMSASGGGGTDYNITAARGLYLTAQGSTSAGGIHWTTNGSERMTLDASGGLAVGRTSTGLATNATAGFFYPPYSPGAPTGTPATTYTGTVPMLYDTLNNKLWVYNGAWKSAAFT